MNTEATTQQNPSNQETRIMTPTYQVTSKQDMLMQSLTQFFNTPGNLGKMIPILTQSSKISLRLFDWFVTNFAKRKNVSYFITETKNGREQQRYFNVYLHYKSQLKAYSKQQFDPFCRKWKIIKKKKVYCGIKFYYETTQTGKKKFIETTVGQLNFFRWAIANNVLEYVIEHFNEIAKDMLESAPKKKSEKSEKSEKSGKTKKTAKTVKADTKSDTKDEIKAETKSDKLEKPKKTSSSETITKTLKNVPVKPSKTPVSTTTIDPLKPVKAASKPEVTPVSISASKQLTKRKVHIIVDFN